MIETLESRKEIIIYHLKKPATYFIWFSFLPMEYLLTPLIGATMYNIDDPEKEFAYTCFKLNRCLQSIVIFQVLNEFEAMQALSTMKLFLTKFLLATVFSIHIFAVIYRLILEYIYGW